MSAPESVVATPDPDCRCGDGRWSHKRGSGGCRVMDCACDKYEPPKGAAALTVDPASPVPGVAAERPDEADPGVPVGGFAPAESGDVDLPVEPEPTCAYPNGEDQGEHDHALCEDVVAERDEARWARDGFEVQRDQAYERVDELTAELGREQAEHQSTLREQSALNAEVLRLRAELDRVNADRQRAQDALDEATWATPQASLVLWRYDADQCTSEACGSRYTVPTEHPHPLTPVTVLVVRREVPGA